MRFPNLWLLLVIKVILKVLKQTTSLQTTLGNLQVSYELNYVRVKMILEKRYFFIALKLEKIFAIPSQVITCVPIVICSQYTGRYG